MQTDADQLIYAPDLFGERRPDARGGPLAAEFTAPPLSIVDGRPAWWLERRTGWLSLGIRSEEGRDGELIGGFANAAAREREYYAARGWERSGWDGGGGSVFDPVLCEVCYRWWCPPGGNVLDPFAGGSVRGIVAACLGYNYLGIELRPEQVAANRAQAEAIAPPGPPPVWIEGDCLATMAGLAAVDGLSADFIFTCPPYGNLERYSDDPADLSTLEPEAFRAAYGQSIAAAAALLRPHRYAAYVVASYRDKRGNLCDLPGWTVAAAEAAGLAFYNDAIYVPRGGTAPMRARVNFARRKLTPCHQRLLVFCKGDAALAAAACLTPEPRNAEESPRRNDTRAEPAP